MLIKLTKIYSPQEARLREDYGDELAAQDSGSFTDLLKKLVKYGQLQDILIRPLDREEFPDAPEEAEFSVVDGGRRLLAFELLASQGLEVPGIPPGEIGATIERMGVRDPLHMAELEFYATEVRKAFTWQEKAKFVRLIHFGYIDRARADDKVWGAENTALLLDMTVRTVNRYLELTEDPDVFEDEKVQGARTFVAATKQAKRQKALGKRRREVEETIAEKEKGGEKSDTVYAGIGDEDILDLCKQGDCRELITEFDDETFDFIHWDPPYGGEQAGGSTSVQERIDDTQEYAIELMTDMFPKIHQVMKQHRWMALWYHPINYQWILDHLSQTEDFQFWVNPYPNVWYKRNRKADGHEISRFSTNATEYFLHIGKWEKSYLDLILPRTDRQNVYVYDMPVGSQRRHIMHKPADLLGEITTVISIEGEVGYDPSVGSGSFFEGCVDRNRKGYGAELSEEYWLTSCDAYKKALQKPSSDDLTDEEAITMAVEGGLTKKDASRYVEGLAVKMGRSITIIDITKLIAYRKKMGIIK